MKSNLKIRIYFSSSLFLLFISINAMGQTLNQSEMWLKDGYEAFENNDTLRAFNCLTQAVALGNYDAYNNLGYWYVRCGKEDNKFLKARNLFHQAAEADNKWAMFNLANMYLFGVGVEEDFVKANVYFDRFKKKGIADRIVKSWETTKKDLNLVRWLMVNVDKSFSISSIITLGPKKLVVADSLFKKKKYDGIFKVFKEYAINGHLKSQMNLGIMYWFGYDVTKNINKAIKCYSIAAENNSAYAQFTLASIYYNGIYVKQNRNLAEQLYTKSILNLPEDYEKTWKETVVKDKAAVLCYDGINYVLSDYIYKKNI